MSSVTKHPNSPFFTIIYKDSQGRRVKRSSKLKSKRQAILLAQELERLGKLASRRKILQAHIEKLVIELLESVTGEEFVLHTLDSWIATWMKQLKDRSPKSAYRCAPIFKRFVTLLGDKKDLPLHKITANEVRAYRDKRRPCTSDLTLNLELNYLKSLFNAAQKDGVIQVNPAAQVPLIPSPQKNGRQPFSSNEISQLLRYCDGEMKTLVIVAAHTGLRISDCSQIRYQNFDLINGVITIYPQKTKRKGSKNKLIIPIHPTLNSHLNKLKWPKDESKPILETLSKMVIGSLSNKFTRIVKRAGLAETVVKNGKTYNLKSFHSIRFFAASSMANSGVPSEVRKKILGHASDECHQIYTHIEMKTIRTALNKLPTIDVD